MVGLRLVCALLILTSLLTAQKGPVRVQLTPQNPTASLANSLQVQLTAHKIFLTDLGKQVTGPALTVTWTSSNLAAAAVSSSGLVTGTAVGSAVITAASGPFQGSTTVTIDCSHPNGLGQTYSDCGNPLGTPGTGSSYTLIMAMDAAAAWPVAGTVTTGTCGTDSVVIKNAKIGFACSIWQYSGSLAGYVRMNGSTCACPTNISPTWQ